MDIEQLKNAWKEYDKGLADQPGIHQLLLKTVSVDKTRSLTRTFKAGTLFEIVFNGMFLFYMVDLLVKYRAVPVYAWSGFIVGLMTLGMLAWNVYALVSLSLLRYDDSVSKIQKRIETIHAQNRFRQTSLHYFLFPITMALLAIVFLKWVNLDIAEHVAVILYAVLGSLIVVPFIVWFIKKFPDKELESAIHFLNEIKEFEKE